MLIKVLLVTILLIHSSQSFNPICSICHDIVKLLQKSVPHQPSEFIVDQIAILVCTQKHLQDKSVCKGAVKEMVPIILTSTWKHYSDPHLVCSNVKLCSH